MLNKKQLLLLTISCLLHLLHMIIFSQILKQIYVKISNTQNAENSFMNSYVPLPSFNDYHFANFYLSHPLFLWTILKQIYNISIASSSLGTSPLSHPKNCQ